MASSKKKSYKSNALLLLYTAFLALRVPGYATLMPGVGSMLVFVLNGRYQPRVIIGVGSIFCFVTFVSLFQASSIVGSVKVLFCLLSFFMVKRLIWDITHHPRRDFERIILGLIWLIVAYLLLETSLRIFFPDLLFKNSSAIMPVDSLQEFYGRGVFYQYKAHSPFFTDSNFTGIFLFLWFVVFNHFNGAFFSKKESFFITLLFLVAAVFTFSRVLYAAIILVYLGSKILDKFGKLRAILAIFILSLLSAVLCLGLVVGLLTLPDLMFLLDDGSLQTKIDVWMSLISNFNDVGLFNQLFGFGIGQGKYVFSYEGEATAHALIPQLVGEIGIVGLLIYLSATVVVFSKIEKGLLYFFAIMVLGASLFDPWDPLFFAVMGFLSAVPSVRKISIH